MKAATATAHASARRSVVNTEVEVTLGVSVRSRELKDAAESLGSRSTSLVAYLKTQRVGQLTTGQVSLTPETEQKPGQAQRVVAYVGEQTLSFRTSADRFPEIAAAALQHGANTIDGASPAATDEALSTARREAAREASREALDQVGAAAEAAGLRTAAVVEIDVDPDDRDFAKPVAMAALSRSSASQIAIEAGSSDVTATVRVIVQLAPK